MDLIAPSPHLSFGPRHMLTYGMLIRELPNIARDQIGTISARHGVPARDVEAALELLMRRGIARRRRWRDRSSGHERTTWTLISDADGAVLLAAEKLIEVDSPLPAGSPSAPS